MTIVDVISKAVSASVTRELGVVLRAYFTNEVFACYRNGWRKLNASGACIEWRLIAGCAQVDSCKTKFEAAL